MSRHFTKDLQIANKHMQEYLPSENCKLKIIMRSYYPLVKRHNLQTLTTPNVGKDVAHQEISFIAGTEMPL